MVALADEERIGHQVGGALVELVEAQSRHGPMIAPMPHEPPSTPSVDLLIVGGLTIDRFADGSSAPGGSVLHSSRAAAAAGLRVAVVAAAGDEPDARRGLEEIGRVATLVHVRVPRTIAFRHDESGPIRRLYLDVAATPLDAPPVDPRPTAVLYAPVANEIGSALSRQVFEGVLTAAILQGWLRILAPGALVQPRLLRDLPRDLVARLGELDILIASREDLLAEGDTPNAQLDVLRSVIGPRPTLVVTEGIAGAWIDAGAGRLHIDVAEPITRVPTVGAGDAYAAVLAARLGSRRHDLVSAAADAAAAVSRMLAARRETAAPGR
jgi:sugar/nucleoside kinase (ribokinase family)